MGCVAVYVPFGAMGVGKFELAADNHVAEAVATVINRAAREHVQYVEFMHTADGGAAAKLGMQVGWDSHNDFAKMRETLLAGGLKEITAATARPWPTTTPAPEPN